jgi:hypothetical protein
VENQKKYTTQSVQDFLEKGGSINILPPVEHVHSHRVATQAVSGHSSLMTLDDAAVFHGEQKEVGSKLKKELVALKAQFDLYPKPLQDKEVARLKRLVKSGEIEDNGYFDEEE